MKKNCVGTTVRKYQKTSIDAETFIREYAVAANNNMTLDGLVSKLSENHPNVSYATIALRCHNYKKKGIKLPPLRRANAVDITSINNLLKEMSKVK